MARFRQWLVVLFFCLMAIGPVLAGPRSFRLIDAQALTSSGNGSSATPIPTLSSGEVTVFVSSVSGTSLVFDLWLESCETESGTGCAPITASIVAKDANPPVAGNPTVSTNVRDIIDNKTSTTSETFTASYPVLATQYIRLRWTISGTTPSFLVTAYFRGK